MQLAVRKPVRVATGPAIVAVMSAAVFVFASGHLVDDTYITLSYARNLALHGHWGLVADSVSNTATSPLNVLALGALTFLVRDAVVAAGILFVLCQVGMYLALRRIGDRTGLPGWFAGLTVAALLVNPLLISSIGLEVALGATGLAWLLVLAGERRPLAFGCVAGAVALVRLDLLVFVAVIFVARKRFWADAGRSVLGAALVTGPWFLFSWVTLGGLVPDTLVIKTLQGAKRAWNEWTFGNGLLMYWEAFPAATALSLAPVALAVLLCPLWILRRDRAPLPFAALAAGGIAYFVVYVGLTVPPYHWYYGPTIVAATVFCCALAARLPGPFQLACVGLVAASAVSYAVPELPRRYAPITTNYTSSAQYLDIGEQVRQLTGGRPVGSHGEIGALAYACDCPVTDVFSDRGLFREALAERQAGASRIARGVLNVNFAFFDQGVRPRHLDFQLVRQLGGTPPSNALASWPISAPMLADDRLYLVPTG
ncbi:hypothetical protein EWH70_05305 [Amycolatopsis suaedae]|uniref:DUF2029 domain-containing protein n=2 Tax=Amycolatopsis suaedae TaxID=2510978 RepID=A0A4Q7JFT3_9PSEU|nr:hypothetical protein EWH70_05305 [Amycolatopsis suaedae]